MSSDTPVYVPFWAAGQGAWGQRDGCCSLVAAWGRPLPARPSPSVGLPAYPQGLHKSVGVLNSFDAITTQFLLGVYLYPQLESFCGRQQANRIRAWKMLAAPQAAVVCLR